MISSNPNIKKPDGVHLLPKGLLDFPGEEPAERENRPPIMRGRHVDYGFSSDPVEYHKFIREFTGTSKELVQYFVNTPTLNKSGAKLRNVHFYSAFIRHGSKGGSFFTICDAALRAAIAHFQFNSVICNSFMTSANLIGDFGKVLEGFQTALKCQCCDAETFNIFMKAAGKDRMDDVEKAYNMAVEAGVADIVTANTIIDLAGKKKMFNLAIKVYEEWKDRADAYTYSSVIRIYGLMKCFDKAKAVFEEVRRRSLTGSVKFNEYHLGNYMKAANCAGHYQEAIAAYETAPKEIRNAFVESEYCFAVKCLNRK